MRLGDYSSISVVEYENRDPVTHHARFVRSLVPASEGAYCVGPSGRIAMIGRPLAPRDQRTPLALMLGVRLEKSVRLPDEKTSVADLRQSSQLICAPHDLTAQRRMSEVMEWTREEDVDSPSIKAVRWNLDLLIGGSQSYKWRCVR